MDKILKELEADYVKAVKDNECTTVEAFIEQFLYDSWSYNEQNMESIKTVMSRYSQGEINPNTFSGAFNGMLDHVQRKLEELDSDKNYSIIQEGHGASMLIAFVDGLVVQYFAGVYTVVQLKDMTPQVKQVVLQALRTES